MAVDAAGRQEAHHVHRAAARARLRERFAQHRVLRELAGRDRVVDARQVLVDDASRALNFV